MQHRRHFGFSGDAAVRRSNPLQISPSVETQQLAGPATGLKHWRIDPCDPPAGFASGFHTISPAPLSLPVSRNEATTSFEAVEASETEA
jgi:hypothetical protein